MLECFEDYPRQTIHIYKLTSTYNPSTGVETTGYTLRETREVFVFQKSSVQNIFAESIVDQLELIIVTDTNTPNTDLVKHNDLWYSLAYPDDILAMGEVVTFGLVKVKAPDNVTETPEARVDVLGDIGGLI